MARGRCIILFLDEGCAQVARCDYRKYSGLRVDFFVPTDRDLRRKLFNAMMRYEDYLIEQAKVVRREDRLIAILGEAKRSDDPAVFFAEPLIDLGRYIAMLRLPKNVMDEASEEIVKLVREWCTTRRTQ